MLSRLGLLVPAVLTLACSPVPTLQDRPARASTCQKARDPLHPLVVEWSAANRVGLDAASRRAGVVVAVDGCHLRVLRSCEAHAQYTETEMKAERRAVVMKDQDDVAAWLPFAPPSVGAGLTAGSSLVLDVVVTKDRALPEGVPDLDGDCAEATHLVRKIRLGAYALDTRATAEAVAKADVGPLSAGGSHTESDARRKASGDPDQCAASPSGPGCDAPVELELVPLPPSAPRPGSETMMMRDR
jgi:hypothetical protein